MCAPKSLLEIKQLTKVYYKRSLFGKPEQTLAVDSVSFDIGKGEIFGLIGESGSGKSTIGRLLLRLVEPTSGQIILDGTFIERLGPREMLPFRRRIQIVFQNSYSTFNPRKSVGEQVALPIKRFKLCAPREIPERVVHLMERVGLTAEQASRYPHEFSGGQRQRINIARALAAEPEILVLDEPTSALDVSVQAQILNLLQELQEEKNLTYLLITHNLGIVEYLCDRVGVMFRGKLVELADVEELYLNPKHQVTQELLNSVFEPELGARGGDSRNKV